MSSDTDLEEKVNIIEPINSTPKSSVTVTKETNDFVLYIWPGDWELESLDADCLTALVNLLNYPIN